MTKPTYIPNLGTVVPDDVAAVLGPVLMREMLHAQYRDRVQVHPDVVETIAHSQVDSDGVERHSDWRRSTFSAQVKMWAVQKEGCVMDGFRELALCPLPAVRPWASPTQDQCLSQSSMNH
jgi:hypothetical protein